MHVVVHVRLRYEPGYVVLYTFLIEIHVRKKKNLSQPEFLEV